MFININLSSKNNVFFFRLSPPSYMLCLLVHGQTSMAGQVYVFFSNCTVMFSCLERGKTACLYVQYMYRSVRFPHAEEHRNFFLNSSIHNSCCVCESSQQSQKLTYTLSDGNTDTFVNARYTNHYRFRQGRDKVLGTNLPVAQLQYAVTVWSLQGY